MATKKVRIKVKKKKLKVKRIIICLIVIISLYFLVTYLIKQPVKNIYIKGNNYVTDNEILQLSGLSNYPSFLLTTSYEIKNNILVSDYIKEVKVIKKIGNKIYLEIEEYMPLCINIDGKLILESGDKLENNYNITDIPLLINNVDAIYDRFVSKLSLIDSNILRQISQIEYVPNKVDNERFLFYMNDGNYVYVTLSKIKKINKYHEITEEMAGNKGIVYLDSGDYVEIKEPVTEE